VAALDIQQFRKMNEEFGHDVGDAALRAVARCLTCTIRKTDVAGRIGGDEFALLFPETQRHEAMMALARLSACVEDLNASGELPVEVRLSLGIVDQIMSPQDMLTAALKAATRQFDTSPRAGSRELDARSETDLSDVGSAPR
jgi:diguanylate cyclase (GGDEF)-like protein